MFALAVLKFCFILTTALRQCYPRFTDVCSADVVILSCSVLLASALLSLAF